MHLHQGARDFHEVHLRSMDVHSPRLDLREVQQGIKQREQVLSADVDQLSTPDIFGMVGLSRSSSENPRIAFRGVRNSCEMNAI